MGSLDQAMLPKYMLIDGKLVGAQTSYPSVNPATGEVLGYAPDASGADAKAAVAAARRAFDETSWSTDVAFRTRCLEQLHAALDAHREELRELTIADVGAPRGSTYGAQLDEPIEIVSYYAKLLPTFEFTEDLGVRPFMGNPHRRWVEYEAAGVVAAIIGYNYPTQLALAKLSPALAAGCTVVLKAAPQTPLITLALADLIVSETEIPPGVVNIISSSQASVGEVLTTSPDVDVVTFTGSTATGRRIMAAAAATIKRVFLELGGKSAMVVLDDADTSMLPLMSAFAACSHAGQGCAIPTRVVLPREQHDALVEAIAGAFDNVTFGDPADVNNYMGPLITEQQREKVHGIVTRAVEAGATLVRGGEPASGPATSTSPPCWPTSTRTRRSRRTSFGPVLVVIAHDGDDDAVKIANNSIYGLSGGVFSGDEERALKVARRIRTGTIGVNGGVWFGPDAPFGGYKQSGVGREMGRAGLEEFLESKTLAVPHE